MTEIFSAFLGEEAPSLGKPVLVMRQTTERPEALEVGSVLLVGTNINEIVSHVRQLLTDEFVYMQMSKVKNPYGDGKSASRIVRTISAFARQTNSTLLEAVAENITAVGIKVQDEAVI